MMLGVTEVSLAGGIAIKIRAFNPKYIYPLGIFTIVIPGFLLSINYRLLGENYMAAKQIKSLWTWTFNVTVSFTFFGYFLYDKVANLEIYIMIYYFLINSIVSYIWIKKQYRIYKTKY